MCTCVCMCGEGRGKYISSVMIKYIYIMIYLLYKLETGVYNYKNKKFQI